MEYNIVTNYKIIQEAKKYQHYVVSLGYASTERDGDRRKLRDKDKFQYFYNKRYNTTIYGQGYIGDISFYTDHFIKEDLLAIYCGQEEFIFEYDFNLADEKGIEWYLGSLLMRIEQQMEIEKVRAEVASKVKEEPAGNPYKLVPGHAQYNPGNVTFEDIKAYKEAKRLGTLIK